MSQTYIFTVVVNGEDVQDAADQIREHVIEFVRPPLGDLGDVSDVHVTESVRVSDGANARALADREMATSRRPTEDAPLNG